MSNNIGCKRIVVQSGDMFLGQHFVDCVLVGKSGLTRVTFTKCIFDGCDFEYNGEVMSAQDWVARMERGH